MFRRQLGIGWGIGLLVWGVVSAQWALAQPKVADIMPRGLQLGGSTRVVFKGSGLDEQTRLLAPFAIASQKVVGEAKDQQVELEIELAADAPNGIHQVWLVNRKGASQSFLIAVDGLEQLPLSADVQQLPVALHGAIRGNSVQSVDFPATAGQRLVVEIQAKRLGGGLQPVLRLYNSEGRQLAASNPRPDLSGDARLEYQVEKDETLTVEIQDLLLRAAMPAHYRLAIGQLDFGHASWPIGVSMDQVDQQQTGVVGSPNAMTAVLALPPTAAGWYPIRIQDGNSFSGFQPRQFVAPWREVTEQSLAETPLESSELPLGISGVLSKDGEHDRLLVPVPSEKKLAIEVWADRMGSPIDPIVVARVPGGKELGRGDDAGRTKDPQFQITVPKGQQQIELEIWDLLGKGGEDSVYRILIRDADAPGLSLSLPLEAVSVSPDGGALIAVPVNRQRFQGDVQLRLSQDIPGVEVTGGWVPANSNRGLLLLRSTPDAEARVVNLLGESPDASVAAVAAGRGSGALSRWLPWHDRSLAVVPTSPAGLGLDASQLQPETVLWQGGIVRVPVTLSRAEDKQGPVRFRLLTTQQMPRKKIKKDNKDVEVDAVERALRLDESVTLGKGVNTGELPIAVPLGLKPGKWGMAVVAELLTDDKQRVVATSATEVVFPEVKQALSLEVEGEKKFELPLGKGGTGSFKGKITRHNGFESPVIVTITGLPQMMEIPEVELAADESEFELPVMLTAETKPEQIQNLRLVAQAWDADGYQLAESPSVKVNILLVEDKKEADEGKEQDAKEGGNEEGAKDKN